MEEEAICLNKMRKNKCTFLVAGENSANEYKRQGHQNKENWMLPV